MLRALFRTFENGARLSVVSTGGDVVSTGGDVVSTGGEGKRRRKTKQLIAVPLEPMGDVLKFLSNGGQTLLPKM